MLSLAITLSVGERKPSDVFAVSKGATVRVVASSYARLGSINRAAVARCSQMQP